MKSITEIARPSPTLVRLFLDEWNSLENYTLQENSLQKLFLKTYPLNVDINDVLIKVCSLNDFYSTNIYSPFVVAKHIVELNIDDKIRNNDLNVVNEIALVKMKEGKERKLYSFATKYCSHHKPEIYPIYDSFVDEILIYFKKKDVFDVFDDSDLKSYKLFKEIMLNFRSHYDLEDFELKEIDRYLWLAGKKHFPKDYKKKK